MSGAASMSAAAAPRIRINRAGAGLAWVQRGLRLFARQPFLMVVLVGLGVLVLLTISVLPGVGDFASLVLAPSVSLGAVAICRSIDRGQTPSSSLYLATLREPMARLRLLQLGIYSAVYVGLASLLLSQMAPPVAGVDTQAVAARSAGAGAGQAASPATGAATGPAAAPISGPGAGPPATGDTGAAVTPPTTRAAAGDTPAPAPMPLPMFLAMVALLLPYMMTMWFAPVLAGWHALPAPKALFFSFFACWRNRLAMLVYMITLLGIIVIAVLVLGSLIEILNAKAGIGLFLVVAPLGFVTTAIAQSANLAMIKDVIDAGDGDDDGAVDEAGGHTGAHAPGTRPPPPA